MSVFIVTVAALSTVVLLCAASTLPRADAADVSVADFADAVRRSSACRDNTLRVRRRAQKWVRFYDALLNDGRFESYKQGSSTVDCVAFELQPALVEASHTNDADTLVAAQKMRWRRRHLDSHALPSGACGVHRVPVVRPVVDSPFGACPRLRAGVPVKSKPHRRRRQGAHKSKPAKSSGKWNGYSYEYVDSPFEQMINMTSSWATFALSSALGLPIPYVPADNTSHAINQLWWTTTAGLAPTTVSLECGWIRSNYFTNDTQTTLFAFSTPDAYSNQSSNGPDSYNLAGGFVQYPGSPALGAAMNEIMMALEYRVLPDNMGFELWYRFFDARRGAQSSFDNVTWTSKDWLPFGFYPMARYHWGVPQFDFFQVGSESCIADGATVQASGSILQWGQDGQCYPLANQFFGEGDYSATYVGESWTHGTANNSTVAVVFNGTNF